jgi:hypothetical protein
MKYHAQRDCHWDGRYFRRGEVYDGPKEPPHHFLPEDAPIPPEVTPRLGSKLNAKNPYKPVRAPSRPTDEGLPSGVPGKGMPESVKGEPPKGDSLKGDPHKAKAK